MNTARKAQSIYLTTSLENVLANPWDLLFPNKGGYRLNKKCLKKTGKH